MTAQLKRIFSELVDLGLNVILTDLTQLLVQRRGDFVRTQVLHRLLGVSVRCFIRDVEKRQSTRLRHLHRDIKCTVIVLIAK